VDENATLKGGGPKDRRDAKRNKVVVQKLKPLKATVGNDEFSGLLMEYNSCNIKGTMNKSLKKIVNFACNKIITS